MNYYSLLGECSTWDRENSLFTDLNLHQLFEEMFKGQDEYAYQVAADLKTVQYRQEIMKELEEQPFEEALRRFLQQVNQAKEYRENARSLEEGDGSASWYLKAAYTYYKALDECIAFLEGEELLAEGFQNFLAACQEITQEPEYRRNYERAVSAYEEFVRLRYSIRIEKDHICILSHVIEEDIIAELSEQFPMHIEMPERMPRLLPGSDEGTKIEQRIFSYLRKKNPSVFKEMRLFARECKDIFSEEIMEFCREISFYLSYVSFRQYMEAAGHVFCYPKFRNSGMEVEDGYDLALAYKNYQEGKETVSNDYQFRDDERFFVVTGANQGGKTTFGRSVGQLIYFANMGFPVPAGRAELPFFAGLVTHFSVEESMESGRGKLKEELARLAPIMHGKQKGVFVIINELFTSAATYDAAIMGRRVMEHFLEQDCYGIYVTHVDELAKESDKIVSVVASIEGEDRHVRTYKIVRQPAEGKGYVETIVDQFGLSYEDIVRRLGRV